MQELAGMVNLGFTVEEFKIYLRDIVAPKMGAWRPRGVVLHNTGLNPHWTADVSNLRAIQLMKNTSVTWASPPNSWSSGPHLMIGKNGYIVASTPLWIRGTHSPSFNFTHWGIEMVGDYDIEQFPDAQCSAVVSVIKALMQMLGHEINSDTFKLHKEDPKTKHKHCPGAHCGDKPTWLARLNAASPTSHMFDLPHHTVMAFSEGMKTKLKNMEAFRDKAYSLKGIWHIGWGFRDGFRGLHIDATSTMSLADANKLFDDATSDLAQQFQLFVTAPLKQHQLDGLGLLAWNIGPGALKGSTIVKRLNAGDVAGAGAAFMMWIKWSPTPGAPKVDSEELKKRRTYEKSVFDGVVDLSASPMLTATPVQPPKAAQPVALPPKPATTVAPTPGTAPMAPRVIVVGSGSGIGGGPGPVVYRDTGISSGPMNDGGKPIIQTITIHGSTPKNVNVVKDKNDNATIIISDPANTSLIAMLIKWIEDFILAQEAKKPTAGGLR